MARMKEQLQMKTERQILEAETCGVSKIDTGLLVCKSYLFVDFLHLSGKPNCQSEYLRQWIMHTVSVP